MGWCAEHAAPVGHCKACAWPYLHMALVASEIGRWMIKRFGPESLDYNNKGAR